MSLHLVSALTRGVQEDGALPGEGLTAVETFVTFFAVPVGLFLAISFLTYVFTAERKKYSGKSSITSIE
jgi:hypothetical protein